MKTLKQQRGISLVMALIMLVVLTLTAISSTSSVNSSIRIAGNMMIQDEVLTANQMAIDSQTSVLANFTTAVDRDVEVDIDKNGTMDYTVTLYAPVCYSSEPAQPNSYSLEEQGSTQNKTYWDVRADVTDTRTGATATVHEGVRITLPSPLGC